MPGEEQETVTRQDLTDFRSFLIEHVKSHTSDLSSKFAGEGFYRRRVRIIRL